MVGQKFNPIFESWVEILHRHLNASDLQVESPLHAPYRGIFPNLKYKKHICFQFIDWNFYLIIDLTNLK